MDRQQALRLAAILFFPVVGFAWPSMKRSVALMKGEVFRRTEETKALRELYKAARHRVTGVGNVEVLDDVAGETFAEAMDRRNIDLDRAYLTFLSRKRLALCVGLFFVLLGAVGLAHGRWEGFAPILVGGGFSLEIAWLSEYRLWQIRGQRLSKEEAATLRDYWMEEGAWRRALDPERGFGLSKGSRRYRRWLWAKRLGLAVVAGSTLTVGVDILFHRNVPWSMPAVIGSAAATVLLVEFRLAHLRHVLGRSPPVLGFLRPEIGACYEGLTQ